MIVINKHTFFVTALMVITVKLFIIGPAVAQACPNGENYQPCNCSLYTNGIYDLKCYGVSLAEVSDVFKRTTAQTLHSFNLSLSPFECSTDDSRRITIPANLMNQHSAQRIFLHSRNYQSIKIEPEAFQSSRPVTSWFQLTGFNMSQMDFDFMKGFENVIQLDFWHMLNVHLANWTSLPSPQNLWNLYIVYSSGLNDWTTFPALAHGLEYLNLYSNQIQNDAMDRILNWTLDSSAHTLRYLSLSENNLTSIPRLIPSFASLKFLDLSLQNTQIPAIAKGSLNFSAPVEILEFNDNGIETIEPGAFQGDFSHASGTAATVRLGNNKLTRFEESVFKDMLQQMFIGDAQYCCGLDIEANPIDCKTEPCHLAWLIRDNRDLLQPLKRAYCSNGTSFRDLNQNAFDHCPTPFPSTVSPNSGHSFRMTSTMPIYITSWIAAFLLVLL